MIRFNIIGTGFLDFEDEGGLAFKTDNPFFRFAAVSIGRSVEFTVPATDRNRQMLRFGEDPNEDGAILRTSHQCQVVYDGGEMMGTLTVTSYEGDAFKCVFYMEVLPWIDTLQNRKLSDCPTYLPKGGVEWSAGNVIDANAATPSEAVLILRYDNGLPSMPNAWELVPSVNLRTLLVNMFSLLNITFSSTLSDKYWMVAGSMKGGDEDSVTFSAADTVTVGVTQTQGYFTVVDIDIEYARAVLFGALVGGGSTATKGFQATQDVEMTFGSSVARPLFLVKWSEKLKNCEVIGGSGLGSTPGIDPLDRRTIKVNKGDILFFGTNANVSFDAQGTFYGWKDIAHPMSETVTVVRSVDLTLGEGWYIRNNMPDMTLFEFLRSIAVATGLELRVTDSGVSLNPGIYGDRILPLENVVSVDRVERIVDAWGKDTGKAITDFDSEEYVTDRIIVSYHVENDTRQGEATYTSKFSEGNAGKNGVVIQDVEVANNVGKFKAKKWTLAYVDDNSTYLQRVPLPDPLGYFDIATNSTCLVAKVSAGEAAFFSLTPDTVFIWRGAAFVWTSANWSGGMMTLTLQKVSQAYADSKE